MKFDLDFEFFLIGTYLSFIFYHLKFLVYPGWDLLKDIDYEHRTSNFDPDDYRDQTLNT
jgi:hypothetical protein